MKFKPIRIFFVVGAAVMIPCAFFRFADGDAGRGLIDVVVGLWAAWRATQR